MVRVQSFWEATWYKAYLHWRAGIRQTKPTLSFPFNLTPERAAQLAADADQVLERVLAQDRRMRNLSTLSHAAARGLRDGSTTATRTRGSRRVVSSKVIRACTMQAADLVRSRR